MALLLTLETTKGTFTGRYGRARYWLQSNQPSHATLVVDRHVDDYDPGQYRIHLRTDLSIDDAWDAAWLELVEEVLDDWGRYATNYLREVTSWAHADEIAGEISSVLEGDHPHREMIEEVGEAIYNAARVVRRNHEATDHA